MRKGQTGSTASLRCSAELRSIRVSQAEVGAWADSLMCGCGQCPVLVGSVQHICVFIVFNRLNFFLLEGRMALYKLQVK